MAVVLPLALGREVMVGLYSIPLLHEEPMVVAAGFGRDGRGHVVRRFGSSAKR